jgi:uncharacterized protein (DUF1330 family)
MAVYAVVNVQITDPDRYTEYREQAPDTIARYGGQVPRTRGLGQGARRTSRMRRSTALILRWLSYLLGNAQLL